MLNYYMPTNINFETNCLSKLTETLNVVRAKNILIVTGNKSAKISGALKEIKKKLKNRNIIIFDSVRPNPTIKSLQDGLKLSRKNNIDVIIGLGGGSAMDYGKAVSILHKEKFKPHDFFYKKRKLKAGKIIFVAIPTTFGTSSEITPYAVMTDESRKTKITLKNKRMFPDYAFINPELTLTMQKPLIAASCADLFSHALEAFWSVGSNALTDCFAAQGIKTFLSGYKETFKYPHSLKYREQLCLASVYSGLAFSNTGTTACHFISYPLTAIFGIPHGVACILTLAPMLSLNAKADTRKILKLCNIMGCDTLSKAKEEIALVMRNLNIESHLSAYGLTKKDLNIIGKDKFALTKLLNNPYKLKNEDIKKIVKKIY